MTQAELGEKSGYGGSYISHIENGRRLPQTGALQKILIALREGGATKGECTKIKDEFFEKVTKAILGAK